MMEWCRGVNLAHVVWVDCSDKPGKYNNKIYRLMGINGLIAEVELDDDEYNYFFCRAIIAAPPGVTVLRLVADGDDVVRQLETVIALALNGEFTEGTMPICADGLAFPRSTDGEMVLWRFPGGLWHEICGSETYLGAGEAEAEFRKRLAKMIGGAPKP